MVNTETADLLITSWGMIRLRNHQWSHSASRRMDWDSPLMLRYRHKINRMAARMWERGENLEDL